MAPSDGASPEPVLEFFADPEALPALPELFADPDGLPEPPPRLPPPPEPLPGAEREPVREPGLEREAEPESDFDDEPWLLPFVATSALSAACAGCPRPRKSEAIPLAAAAFSPLPLTVSAGGFGSAFVSLGPDLGPLPFGLVADAVAVLSTSPTPATAIRGPTRFRTMYCWPIVQKFVVIQ